MVTWIRSDAFTRLLASLLSPALLPVRRGQPHDEVVVAAPADVDPVSAWHATAAIHRLVLAVRSLEGQEAAVDRR